jgi:NAD(P)-dependent dehydrogenase (short-subunit alcohol dehydrogenase family)
MGRALARVLAQRGAGLFLLGRNAEELDRSARDLAIRGRPQTLGTGFCDLLEPGSFAPALERAEQGLGGLDTVVITAGLFAAQEALEADALLRRQLLSANFTHTIEFCEEARRRLLARGGGTLCAFSSVAGDRGRAPVVLYGAAKAGLSRYLEGLDHRYRRAGLRVLCVKPGFVHTSMTAGLRAPPFAGSPERVARQVARALERGRPELYAPPVWRWVMWGVRRLPRAVLRRAAF